MNSYPHRIVSPTPENPLLLLRHRGRRGGARRGWAAAEYSGIGDSASAGSPLRRSSARIRIPLWSRSCSGFRPPASSAMWQSHQ